MSFQSFIKGLLPSFKRDRLASESRNLRNQLTTIVLPAYASSVQSFKAPLTSPEGIEFTKRYDLMVPKRNVTNSIVFDINERLQKLPKLLDAIDKQLADGFSGEVVSAGLTLRKANVIRATEVLGFLSKFSMGLVNAIAHYEIVHKGVKVDYVSDVTPGEYKRLMKYLPDFAQLLHAVTSLADYQNVFDHIPEAHVEDDVFRSSYRQNEVDPLSLFLTSGFKGNPIYSLLMMYAEFQMDNHKQMQDQKKLLEVRLLQLQRTQERQPSPQLEREIRALSSRVANLAAEIRKTEESFA